MIDRIADAIVEKIEGLGIFKKVDRTITAAMLKTPPTAAVFLAYDRKKIDTPTVTRVLGWDVALMISALGAGKGQGKADNVIDSFRDALTGWRPWTTGGVMPAEVQEIRLEGIEGTLLVYTGRLTMEVMPAMIQNNG